jgi:aminocarboxymuconate-semialdehyde decarboxylase
VKAVKNREIDYGIPHLVDPEARLKHMEKYEIGMQVLTLTQNVLDGVTSDEAVRLCKIANDSMCRISERYPDKFKGIVSVPLSNVGEALDELDRAVQDLGLRGVQLNSNVGGRPLDSPEFLPFYDKVVKYDIPILLHPTNWRSYELLEKYELMLKLGWPLDTSQALVRLVFSGILDRYPSLKIVAHHLGAMIPFFMGRLETLLLNEKLRGNITAKAKAAIEYFKMFYGDTAVDGWRPALACGLSLFGPDHVVFSTDYPMGPEAGEWYIRKTLAAVSTLQIPEEDKLKIFEGNARKLLRLD